MCGSKTSNILNWYLKSFLCFLHNFHDYLLSSFVLCRYPQMSEDAITEACPVCLGNCNCKACLRLDVPVKVSFSFYVHTPWNFTCSFDMLLIQVTFIKFCGSYCRIWQSGWICILAKIKKLSTRSICFMHCFHSWKDLMMNNWLKRRWRLGDKVYYLLVRHVSECIRWKGLAKASWVRHVPIDEAKDEVCHKSLNC